MQPTDVLNIQLVDYDLTNRDESIGHVRIPMKDLGTTAMERKVELEVPALDKHTECKLMLRRYAPLSHSSNAEGRLGSRQLGICESFRTSSQPLRQPSAPACL